MAKLSTVSMTRRHNFYSAFHLAPIWHQFVDWAIGTIGSSRSSALIRIGLVFIIWARFAADQQFFVNQLGWRTIFSVLFYLSTLGMLIGYMTRLCTFIVGLLVFVIYDYFGLFLGEMQVSSHMYWLGIAPLLLTLTPCGKSYSLDRWFAVQQAAKKKYTPPLEQGNLWGLRLIVIQLSMMYFWTALDKLQADFISGDRLEATFMLFYNNIVNVEQVYWGFILLALIIITLEFALAFGMPFSRTRRYLVIPGLSMHALFYALLPVKTYSVTIMLLYLAYFDANIVHRIIDEMSGVPNNQRYTKTKPVVADLSRSSAFEVVSEE